MGGGQRIGKLHQAPRIPTQWERLKGVDGRPALLGPGKTALFGSHRASGGKVGGISVSVLDLKELITSLSRRKEHCGARS